MTMLRKTRVWRSETALERFSLLMSRDLPTPPRLEYNILSAISRWGLFFGLVRYCKLLSKFGF
jgi:hypothetical protein